MAPPTDIPGTTIFGPAEARKGYALNKMCYSFNDAANRAAFLEDEDAYCARYGLDPRQREAIQDIGAQQTGMSVEEFRARLLAAGQ